MTMSNPTPVLIVGAGPTGLTTAIVLERYGIPFRIIDKSVKPVTTSNALAVHARTMEVWDDLGILPKALENGLKIKQLSLQSNDKKILTLDLKLIDSDYDYVLSLSQHQSEAIMIDYLKSKKIDVEMDVELIDFEKEDNGFEITLSDKNKKIEKVYANWIVGCDGIHSRVRDKLNFAFKGKDLPQQFFLADMELNIDTPRDSLYAFTSHNGLLFLIPYQKNNWRMFTLVTNQPKYHHAENITLNDIKELFAKRCPLPVDITNVIWKSTFYLHERLSSAFEKNHIFLIGDAAHVHSPAGGQGMNIGIQDAYNLGWKLAFVIQGKMQTSILATYTEERQPIAKQVIKGTSVLTRLMTVQNPVLQSLRNYVMSLLLKSKKIQKKVVNNLAGLATKYSQNQLINDSSFSDGPKVGMRLPDVNYHGKRLFDYIRGTEFVLLIFAGSNGDIELANIKHAIQELEKYSTILKLILVTMKSPSDAWQDELIDDSDQLIHNRFVAKNCCVYLIRPDKYIALKAQFNEMDKVQRYFQDIIKLKTN